MFFRRFLLFLLLLLLQIFTNSYGLKNKNKKFSLRFLFCLLKKKRKIETFLEYGEIQNKFEMKTQIFFPLKLSTKNGIIQQIRKKSHNVLWNAHLEQDDFD